MIIYIIALHVDCINNASNVGFNPHAIGDLAHSYPQNLQLILLINTLIHTSVQCQGPW